MQHTECVHRWIAWTGALVAAATCATVVWAVATGALQVPERYNPWAPLSVVSDPNILTGFKLRRDRDDRAACLAALNLSGARFEPVPDRDAGGGCGLENAVRLQAGHSLALGTAALLSCRAALSFVMWERHGLQPAAERALDARLVSLQHLGGYACRDVVTGDDARPTGRRSRHATADALDVSGFTSGNGRRISIAKHWHAAPSGQPDAEALFLRDAHDSACRWFDGVLGPDYNRVHVDHFHLDIGGWRACDRIVSIR